MHLLCHTLTSCTLSTQLACFQRLGLWWMTMQAGAHSGYEEPRPGSLTSRFSQTMRVSTAPISRHCSVSATPNTYFPVSWLISSKNLRAAGGCQVTRAPQWSPDAGKQHCGWAHFEMRRFSCTNFTFARVSALSSMAWLKPFSPPAWAPHSEPVSRAGHPVSPSNASLMQG